MDSKNKVGVLLRVAAVSENDIQTQRTACMRYIETHPDWVWGKEYVENGLSGIKAISDREKLLEVKSDIANGVIDILLVLTLDRIGRHKDTPLIVKSFVDMGAEVWSVTEGQFRSNDHINKLLNYIASWQASKSKRTHIRVPIKKKQMAKEV